VQCNNFAAAVFYFFRRSGAHINSAEHCVMTNIVSQLIFQSALQRTLKGSISSVKSCLTAYPNDADRCQEVSSSFLAL